MLSEDEREHMRRTYYIDHLKVAQIARETGHCRQTIKDELGFIPFTKEGVNCSLLDRLTHRASKLEFVGQSYRFRHSLAQEQQPGGEN